MKFPLLAIFLLCTFFANSQNYDIYVSDAGNWNTGPYKIMKYDSEGENSEIFIDDHIAWPQDILFLEDQGIVLISNLNTNDINKFDAETGEFLGKFADVPSGPTRMKIKDNILYVLSWRSPFQVVRFELDGSPKGNFTTQGTDQSIGLDWDNDGNLYVSSYKGFVTVYNSSGEFVKTFIQSNLQGPTNIWQDEDGTWLILDYDATAVKRFNEEGQMLEVLTTGLQYCEGVAISPEGTYLIGHGGNASVDEYNDEWELIGNRVSKGKGTLMLPNAVVLRQKPNSTGNIDSEKIKMCPSIGSEFTMDWKDEIARCEVFSVNGLKVASIEPSNSQWNAEFLPAGPYLVQVTTANGVTHCQKIIVQK